MDFEPFYPHIETEYFRGVEKGKVDKIRTPWGVKYTAFRRRANEHDGPTLVPSAALCHQVEIVRIAKIGVGKVVNTVNPANLQPLTVIQDEPGHAYIANVPRPAPQGQTPEESRAIEDCATELAEAAELLDEVECDNAKREWLEFVQASK